MSGNSLAAYPTLLEFDGQDIAFGLVVGFETEFGYFSLREMTEARGPLGLQPERDLWFDPMPVTQLPEYREKWGDHGPYRGGGGGVPTPEPDTPLPPALPPASAAALPEGWKEEDIAFLLTQLELGPILIADSALGFPTIHDIPNANHVGHGLFRSTGDGYTLYFDGGGAMRHTPSGKGWTTLDVQGDYPYDLTAARVILEHYLVPTPVTEHSETLSTTEALGILEVTLTPTANPAQTLTVEMLQALKCVSQAESVPQNPSEAIVHEPDEACSWEPTLEDQAEFEAWQLELLTGLVHKKDSAFYHALTTIHHPGTLHLALQQVNGDVPRRIRLEERLHALQSTPV